MVKSLAKPSPNADWRFDDFTNRQEELQLFQKHLNAHWGARLPVLMFYGAAGVGKTLLLKALRQETDKANIPFAYLDFEERSGGLSCYSDPASALAALRSQLGVPCPRFDVASAVLQHKEDRKAEPLGPTPQETQFVIDMTSEMAQAAIGMPIINVASWLALKSSSPRWKQFENTPQGEWLKSMLGNQYLSLLSRLEAREIHPLLPEYLLQDLNERLSYKLDSCRGVIFLDSFDSLHAGAPPDSLRHQREQWVRDLYASDTPVLLVIAGRDRLQWEEMDKDFADVNFLQQHLVSGFSEHDARDFLAKKHVATPDLQDAVLRASVARPPGPTTESKGKPAYLPLSLALGADCLRVAGPTAQPLQPTDAAAGQNGQERELAGQFLHCLNPIEAQWILSLAATPRFDEEAAKAVWSTQDSVQRNAAWKMTQHYSFMFPLSPGWWTIHPHVQEALRQTLAKNPDQQRKTHEAWQAYWRGRAARDDDRFAGLSWFHQHCLNPAAALQHWQALAQRARLDQRMTDHYNLLEWWGITGLEAAAPATQEAANALISLALELWSAVVGLRSTNLLRAIADSQAATTLYTPSEFPAQWAMVQNNLGQAYRALPSGERGANLERAIACYQAALTVCNQEVFPEIWAMTQNNLGKALGDLPSGDRQQNLTQAIVCHQSALRIFTRADFPRDWALTQNYLGNAYRTLSTGDRSQNPALAIACYLSALGVFTQADFPLEWALTQNNLGNALAVSPSGDHASNLSQAIACYHSALRVFTQADYPRDWASTQYNLGNAYRALSSGQRQQNLTQAITCYEAALRVFTEAGFRQEWAAAQHYLGDTYSELPAEDRFHNLSEALECYKAAQRVYMEATAPYPWALIQNSIGNVYRDLPRGDRDNFDRAIAFHKAALRVFTEAGFPQEWAQTQSNLGEAYASQPHGNHAHNLNHAMTCFKAALRVCSEKVFPEVWAEVQNNLGKAYQALAKSDPQQNYLEQVIASYEAALRVYTADKYPEKHAAVQRNLEGMRAKSGVSTAR